MRSHLLIFFVFFILIIPNKILAQDDNYISFDTLNGEVFIDDEPIFDTAGFFIDDDQNSYYDSVDKGVPATLFEYFSWMPGYNKYETFDIGIIHYKHRSSSNSDTLILGKYCQPAPYPIFSNYGRRRRRMHRGVDLSYPMGTPVVAAFDGIIRISQGSVGGYGQLIVIRHNNNLETYYAHLSKRLVNPGQMVHAGDTIALGGSTGRSTGPHLHFETRYLGYDFNPNKIINFNTFTLKTDTLYTNGFTVTTSGTTTPNPTSTSIPSSGKTYYRVRRGDTLSRIAVKYHTSVNKIKKLNGMKSDFLREGQKIRVR